MTNIRPKVWLITGAASGFGRCLVDSILARGDRVVATSRTLGTLTNLEGTTDNIRLLQLDVTDGDAAIKAKIDEAAAFWGGLDVVVNNAGTNFLGILEEGGTAYLRKQYEVNVFGVMAVTTAALPYLRAQKQGTVVIMGSRSAWVPEFPGIGAYASSKAAVHALAEGFAGELAHLNIRVLLVEPSAFQTNMLDQAGSTAGLTLKDGEGIADYHELRARVLRFFDPSVLATMTTGDPAKAMEVVVDVVNGEGAAAGKPWPTYLVLGSAAEKAILDKTEKLKKHMEEWKDVVHGLVTD
ncbi:hypothetical protein C8J57DRAFT_1506584 [Mycena rebaudengoi]|nr:hypothetical protein C8J57DRAFT_1506584 [Mycena rebaudengoi]